MFSISRRLASDVASRVARAESAAANHARRTLRFFCQRIASTLARVSGPSPRSSREVTSRHAPSAEAIRRVRSRLAFLSSTSLAALTSSSARARSISRAAAASLASASAASTSSAMRLRRSASSRVAIAARAAASLRPLAAVAAASRAAADASSPPPPRLHALAPPRRPRLSRRAARGPRRPRRAVAPPFSARGARAVQHDRVARRGGGRRPRRPRRRAAPPAAAMPAARARISLASGLPATGRSVAESSAAPFAARTTRVVGRARRVASAGRRGESPTLSIVSSPR